MDPIFCIMRSHSMAQLIFLFGKILFFRKNLESSLTFVLFLNGKQNKKKNLKCGFLFGKDSIWKTKVGSGDQVTYYEGTVKDHNTPLSP